MYCKSMSMSSRESRACSRVSYGAAQSSQQSFHAFVLNDHLDAVSDTSVHSRRIRLLLQLTLKL
jgi:hypothetical protein